MDLGVLINAVKRRKFIYDKQDANYSNRNLISAEWGKIADETGCSEDEARRRWKKLRDYFQRSLREMATHKPGPGGGLRKKWYLFDRMSFVKPYLKDRGVISGTNKIEPLSADEEEDFVDYDDEESRESSSSFAPETSNAQTSTPSIVPTPQNDDEDETEPHKNHESRKRRYQPFLEQRTPQIDNPDELAPRKLPENRKRRYQPSLEQRAPQAAIQTEIILEMAKRLRWREEEETDDDLHFFKNLIPKMKPLSTIEKMECQAEIHNVVLKFIKRSPSSCENS